MTVFKTFWKVVNKYKGTIILYTVMLLTFGTMNLKTNDINTMFTLTDAIGKICIYTKGNITKWSIGTGDIGVVCDHFSVQYQ